jgi:hypothetical protein
MNVRDRDQVSAEDTTLGHCEPVTQVKLIDGLEYQILGTWWLNEQLQKGDVQWTKSLLL